jgi:hypothetical protein
MPLDPSIFQNAGPKPMDIGSLIEMARGKQRLDAESSLGGIIGAATRPDGSIDPAEVGRRAGMAGVLAPDMAARAQSYQQGQNAINQQQMENYTARRKIIAQEAFSHISDPSLNGKKLLNSMIGFMTRPEFIDHGYGATSVINLDQKLRGPNGDYLPPSQLRENIGNLYVSTLDPEHAMEMVDYGFRPDGTPDRVPRAMAIMDYIRKLNANPNHPNLVPPPHVGQAAPARTAQGASNTQPGLTVPSVAGGMPLGTAQSTDQMMAGNAREANYTQEITPWNEALRDVQKLKAQGFSFGPGAKGRQEFQSFLYSLSPQLAAKYGVDPEKLRLFADASKYLTQATNARAAQGLHGSDMQLGAMISGNPNVDINSMSIEDTVKMAMMLRRLQYAQHYVAKNAGPTGYANAASNFPTEHDQRAFGTDLMTEAEHKKLMKSLKKGTPEYERFNRSLKAAHDSGVMPAP